MLNEFNFSVSDLEFLSAQTGSYFGDDGSTDWDSYIIKSSINFGSPLAASSTDSLRPETSAQITEISARLLKTFTTPKAYMKFLSHRGESAQDLLDLLQKLLDHAPLKPQFRVLLYVALVRLCRKSELCPRSFYLQGVKDREEYPHSAGYFGDIYKAYHKGKPVCLKIVRLYHKSSQAQFHKAFSREAVIWAQLSHPNILPFYGIYFLSDPRKSFCLVSPWISRGNVLEFLTEEPNAHRLRLIYGIASGMEHLHENGVVHGDLKSLNILVAEPEQALLTDFGFSYVTDDHGLQGPTLSSSHALGGTMAYEAPERLEDPESRRTTKSDVFAFGMVCYELFTYPPLANVKTMSISSAHSKIVHVSPQSLGAFTEYSGRGLTNEIWQVLESCWSHGPNVRPTATQITQRLPSVEIESVPSEWSLPWRPGFESSKGQVDDTIKKALSHLQTL
ncbi:hypothetical protein H2248_005670 [Termitomyces sp. 'cryptogamus']|nr:hypothetical protein H2248_005670 [Termitomyces sp. 'cryptogamus']